MAIADSIKIGDRFNRLTVTSIVGRNVTARKLIVQCLCDCGTSVNRDVYSLRLGSSQSCGCGRFQHGSSGARDAKPTPEYTVWQQIKDRCGNPLALGYKQYGGRGIRVCDRWSESYESFVSDVGLRPSPEHSIDRVDNDGNYEPGNVRWATRVEQARNRRSNRLVAVSGVTRTVAEWCELTGLKHSTLCARLDNGWKPEAAVSTPLKAQFSRRRVT